MSEPTQATDDPINPEDALVDGMDLDDPEDEEEKEGEQEEGEGEQSDPSEPTDDPDPDGAQWDFNNPEHLKAFQAVIEARLKAVTQEPEEPAPSKSEPPASEIDVLLSKIEDEYPDDEYTKSLTSAIRKSQSELSAKMDGLTSAVTHLVASANRSQVADYVASLAPQYDAELREFVGTWSDEHIVGALSHQDREALIEQAVNQYVGELVRKGAQPATKKPAAAAARNAPLTAPARPTSEAPAKGALTNEQLAEAAARFGLTPDQVAASLQKNKGKR